MSDSTRKITHWLPLSCVLATLLMAGCDTSINNIRESRLGPFPEPQLPSVKPQALSANLKVIANGSLAPDSLKQLNTLLRKQGRLQRQTLVLTPANSRGEQVAKRLAKRLVTLGVPATNISVLPVSASDANVHGDLNVLSQALVVSVPDCRIADSHDYLVHPYSGIGPLGCATRANLAKMVADPEDLLHAKTLDGGDGQAAENAVGRYYDDDIRELIDIDFNED